MIIEKWKSQSVKEYNVFVTPTYFLIDDEHKIIFRPNSLDQISSWMERFLFQQQPNAH